MNIETLSKQLSELLNANLRDFFESEDVTTLTPDFARNIILLIHKLVLQIGGLTFKQFIESYDIEQDKFMEDGLVYRKKYKSCREFMTVLGKIGIERNVYQKDMGGKSIVPLDRKWNMEHEYFSVEMKAALLYSCAHNTPEETSKLMSIIGYKAIYSSTIKTMLSKVGEVIEQHKEQINESIHQAEELPQECDVVTCSLDGVNIRMKQIGKRKGRPRERPGLDQNKPVASAFKNAMCGAITHYDIGYQIDSKDKIPIRRCSKYVSRMPEEHFLTFRKEFEKEIAHMLSSKPKVKILLVDAHPSLKGYIRGNPLFEDFYYLIDFFHACEHLSNLSEELFGKGNSQGQKWYLEKREILKTNPDGVNKVINSAKYYMKHARLGKQKLKRAHKELNYFQKNKKWMNYYYHIKNGWPIGSGVVEAACKTIVKQRMTRSGQRWTTKGGQVILDLRTYVKADRWNNFFPILMSINIRKCA